MPGEITAKLVAQIRDILDDNAKRLIPNEYIIYHKLNYYQQEFMTNFLTSTQEYELAMTTATEYTITSMVGARTTGTPFKIYGIDVARDETQDVSDVGCYIDNYRNKLYIENPVDGVTLYIRAYIKPKTTEDINATTDPIIEADYYKYLVDGVLSEFSTKNNPQKPIEYVYEKVRALAAQLRDANRFTTTGENPFGSINF